MTPKPRYQKVISLRSVENTLVENLNKRGFKTIDIFRAGIAALYKKLRK